MSDEELIEGDLDNSALAKALRKMAAKSIILGCLDAVQNPHAVLAEMTDVEIQGAPQSNKSLPSVSSKPSQPVALPRPMVLAIPENETSDEADQPGVPPKRVRKEKQK